MTSIPLHQLREQKRQAECVSRHDGTCARVNLKAGFRHGFPIDDCDACFAAGPDTSHGVTSRNTALARHISALLASPSLLRLQPHVLRVLIEKHAPPDLRASLEANPEYAYALSRPERWSAVVSSWAKARAFVLAKASDLITTVNPESLSLRQLSCFGDPSRGIPSCPSLTLSADGKHHYCGDCGCGDRQETLLDPDPTTGRSKLEFPHLECPRRRSGFSNADPSTTPPQPNTPPLVVGSNPLDFCKHAFVINLDRRPDRLTQFRDATSAFPFSIARFRAIDGNLSPHPPGWKSGGGAWGCIQSHRRLLEDALHDNLPYVLVFEDDALFFGDTSDARASAFIAAFTTLLTHAPADWECLMLGGQHINSTPESVNEHVVRCVNTQRTHAYLLRTPAIRDLLAHWQTTLYHCDWAMGPFLGDRRRTYAPARFFVGQISSNSDISGRKNPGHTWNPPTPAPVHLILAAPSNPVEMLNAFPNLHFGYDRDSVTGVDRGLTRDVFKDLGFDGRAFKRWLDTLQYEANILGKEVGIWHPAAYLHTGALKEILNDRLRVSVYSR